MVQVSYPGVYIQEVPSGVRTIVPVATSTAAFVGFFKQGPMNDAQEVNGQSDFQRIFGGLDRRSVTSYAIDQFFTNGGTKAMVVRIAAGSAEKAAIEVLDAVGGGKAVDAEARSEGVWGNQVRFQVDASEGDRFTLTARRYSEDGQSILASEVHQRLTVSTYQELVNQSSQLLRLENPHATAAPSLTGTVGGDLSVSVAGNPAIADQSQVDALVSSVDGALITMQISDVNGSNLGAEHQVTLSWTTENPAPTTLSGLRTELQRAIRSARPAAATDPTLGFFEGASVELLKGSGGFRFAVYLGRRDTEFEFDPAFQLVFGGAASTALNLNGAARANVQEYGLGETVDVAAQVSTTAGDDGSVPTTDGALVGDPNALTGIYALTKSDFNILCLPLAAELASGMTRVLAKSQEFCEAKRAFMLVDIPSSVNSIDGMKDWVEEQDIRNKNAAIYFPRLMMADPEDDNIEKSRATSGTMAGLFARTDRNVGVWKAPAGLQSTIRGVKRLGFEMSDAENGTLNPLGVNCLRDFPVAGKVSWGARTLRGADALADEWKYIPIRRLALMIEESLYRGTKWAVFMPNDEPLWAQLRQNVGAFMMNLFRQGAFQGQSPDDAFYVKCDKETTTANDRNLGIVNVEVGFAPLKPAEFVVIKIQQIPDIG